jgi:hypothetical protein
MFELVSGSCCVLRFAFVFVLPLQNYHPHDRTSNDHYRNLSRPGKRSCASILPERIPATNLRPSSVSSAGDGRPKSIWARAMVASRRPTGLKSRESTHLDEAQIAGARY